jgi:2,4-dienoyl-CoA reductase-like NADH-dependent reductase (Old Yellow Enzyme family)
MYQVQFSAAIQDRLRKESSSSSASSPFLTATVGEITSPQQVEQIVSTGRADIAMIGRQLLREPTFALRCAKELGVDVAYPPQYMRSKL